jgi:hypothetical protein
MRGERVGENPRVGAARHRGRAEPIGDPEELLERARHRALSSAAGQNQSAVDVEQEKCGRRGAQSVGYSVRTLPARGPFADGSSSKLTR